MTDITITSANLMDVAEHVAELIRRNREEVARGDYSNDERHFSEFAATVETLYVLGIGCIANRDEVVVGPKDARYINDNGDVAFTDAVHCPID